MNRLQAPYRIAEGTWVVPQPLPIGPGLFGTVNSMVITAKEPVLVDTGCQMNRDQWLEDVCSIVDPDDVRWVYISHGDRDHIGNLDAVLDACPNATVVTTLWGVRGMLPDGLPALDRMIWINDGESFDAGDRTLFAVRPPLWDAPNTRGLFDPTTGVYWGVDSFASTMTHPAADASELDREFWREAFMEEHRGFEEWAGMLDVSKYDEHVARTERVATTIASGHGPAISGPLVAEAFEMMHEVARLGPVPAAGQTVLDAMVQSFAALTAPAAA